ncbi:hypothetical protein JNW88_14360 [Micromonospora sp. ATA32]|nr:hypothetical protein [Micromonospora sp. ATA32]
MRAIEVLESAPPGGELAMAYSTMSQLLMLANDDDLAVDWAPGRWRWPAGSATSRPRPTRW